MNPMIRKGLRQRMRDRRAWLFPSLYLLVLGGAVALGYYWVAEGPLSWFQAREPQGADIGVAVYYTVAFVQMALLLLLAPVFSAGALTIEKEQRTLPALLTSLLTPAQIWWGKFVASVLFLVLLQTSALPVLSLAFALGGVEPKDLLITEGMTLFILAVVCAVGLYCSSYFRRSVHATAVTYGVVLALMILTFVVYVIVMWQWGLRVSGQYPAPEPPNYIGIPLSLNPFFALASPFFPSTETPYPPWLISVLLFAGLGCLSTGLALRNLERAGE
jgi:ABC-type transport system involved in multi-copper enzyme maturation permease subunit